MFPPARRKAGELETGTEDAKLKFPPPLSLVWVFFFFLALQLVVVSVRAMKVRMSKVAAGDMCGQVSCD